MSAGRRGGTVVWKCQKGRAASWSQLGAGLEKGCRCSRANLLMPSLKVDPLRRGFPSLLACLHSFNKHSLWALFWGLSSAQTKPEERLCPHGADMPTVGGRLPRAPWGAPPALSSGGIRSSAGSRDRVRGLVHHHQNSGFYLERVGRPHPAKQRGAPRAAAWRTP